MRVREGDWGEEKNLFPPICKLKRWAKPCGRAEPRGTARMSSHYGCVLPRRHPRCMIPLANVYTYLCKFQTHQTPLSSIKHDAFHGTKPSLWRSAAVAVCLPCNRTRRTLKKNETAERLVHLSSPACVFCGRMETAAAPGGFLGTATSEKWVNFEPESP